MAKIVRATEFAKERTDSLHINGQQCLKKVRISMISKTPITKEKEEVEVIDSGIENLTGSEINAEYIPDLCQ